MNTQSYYVKKIFLTETSQKITQKFFLFDNKKKKDKVLMSWSSNYFDESVNQIKTLLKVIKSHYFHCYKLLSCD